MRYFTLLLLCFTLSATAQTNLKFDTSLLDAEDKWISLPMNKDSVYTYGFVYLDNMTGLTFHLEGTFSFSKDGKVQLNKQPITQIVKHRLSPTRLKVALIPVAMYGDFQVLAQPEWLKGYKSSEDDVHRLFRLGFTHNAWNQPEKALPYLERVKQINSAYPRLTFELAFAYNALKQFDKALAILEEAIKNNPNECGLYKELIYSQMNLKKIDEGMKTIEVALAVCQDKNIRSEMLQNILYYHYSNKDTAKFKVWADKAKVEMASDTKALGVIEKWENELNK